MFEISKQLLEATRGGLKMIQKFIDEKSVVDVTENLQNSGDQFIVILKDGMLAVQHYSGKSLLQTFPSAIELVMWKHECSRFNAYARICSRLQLDLIDLIEQSILDLTDGGKDLIEYWIRQQESETNKAKNKIVHYDLLNGEIIYEGSKDVLVVCNGILDYLTSVNDFGSKLDALDVIANELYLTYVAIDIDEIQHSETAKVNTANQQ